MDKQYDVATIGAGSGGYIAAIRAGQLGLSVACIESNPYAAPDGEARAGRTRLNVGCILSKSLALSHLFEQVVQHTAEHGISTGKPTIDVSKMVARKDAVVTKMTDGIEYLFKKKRSTSSRRMPGLSELAGMGIELDVSDGDSPRRI